MADYRDDLYADVDKSFAMLDDAKDHFTDLPLEDPTPYETPFTPIQPQAWVENSDPDIAGSASVFIDSDGITILNGKIFIEDYSGSSVLGPAGFDGSWVDFIQTGFFNGNFNGGALSASLTTETIVNSGFGADYEASLSTDVPFWVIVDLTGSMSYGIADDSNYGRSLRLTKVGSGASTMTFFTDIPARGQQTVELQSLFVIDRAEAVADKVEYFLSELDADHNLFTGGDNHVPWITEDFSALSAGVKTRIPNFLETSPHQSTRYLRIEMKVTFAATAVTHDTTLWFLGFRSHLRVPQGALYFPYVPVTDPTDTAFDIIENNSTGVQMRFSYGLRGLQISMASAGLGGGSDDAAFVIQRADDSDEGFVITADGQMLWGDGAGAVDTKLFRESTGLLAMPTGDGLRLRNTTDVTTTSVNHPLTIGSDSGDNVGFDNNEIMARSNGSTSVLFLNKDGGNVNIGDGMFIFDFANDQFLATGAIESDSGGSNSIRLDANGNIQMESGYIEMNEISGPAAGGANSARIYIDDNGAGKTRLRVRFNTGAVQTIATEP